MPPILTLIEQGMADAIADMEQGEYNFTWNAQGVNQPDMAKVTFPTAEIFLESEDNLDDPDGPWSNAYMQEATYVIRVRARLDSETDVPTWEINAELNKALDDLKKLFGTNYSVSGYCDTIMYRGFERINEMSGDVFIPKRMETRWRVQYSQDRKNPEQVAEA
jgi:hypothetical protein